MALGRRVWVSRLKIEILSNLYLSIESKRGFATRLMGLEIDFSTNFQLARVALRRGSVATEDRVKKARDRLVEKLNHYNVDNGQLKKVTLKIVATIQLMLPTLVHMEDKVARVDTEAEVQAKSDPGIFSCA